MLRWVSQKASSVDAPYKPGAIRAFYLDLDCSLDCDRYLNRSLDCDLDSYLYFYLHLYLDFDLDHYLDLNSSAQAVFESDLELKLKIDTLKAQLPDVEKRKAFQQWWAEHGENWSAQFRQVMIEHRNIGHNWQFTQAQKEQLRQYFDANNLLIDCFQSDCYVTKATQQYIEDTLLLPMSEIEKIPVPSR